MAEKEPKVKLYTKSELESARTAFLDTLAKIRGGVVIRGCCTQGCCEQDAQEFSITVTPVY